MLNLPRSSEIGLEGYLLLTGQGTVSTAGAQGSGSDATEACGVERFVEPQGWVVSFEVQGH